MSDRALNQLRAGLDRAVDQLRAELREERADREAFHGHYVQAEADAAVMRGLLTLWLNFASSDLLETVPGSNGKSLRQMTEEALRNA